MATSIANGLVRRLGRVDFVTRSRSRRTEMSQNSSLYLMVGRIQLFPEDTWEAVLHLCSQIQRLAKLLLKLKLMWLPSRKRLRKQRLRNWELSQLKKLSLRWKQLRRKKSNTHTYTHNLN
ncbi:PREDICTED: KRR1 small subunit processome component homolog isoform X1 [Myotis davidii]|uniref:KRR1 small subunit processome component homolog isoform X1 n=1 Tax=Myotis davidii TaxID=225400 RepID=UPI000767836A|nr:PREDICTED: KRR1 small subunit processome component homolog isoform X1 [Myotis davidii]